MKVSLNWLKDHVDIEASPPELADLLTMAGLEVEGMELVGAGLEEIVVGKILAVDPHPNADRLAVCRVDTGRGQEPIVCGAPNLEVGMSAPLALPGTRLPDGTVVEESRIRGITSRGMLLAEDELGLTEDHSGILKLPEGSAPGAALVSVMPLEDWVLEVGLTPNRGDCASVRGIAREIAALTGRRLAPLQISFDADGPDIETQARVEIEDPLGCPRYAAGLIREVRLGTSPFWMRYRLHLCGIRGINNIVDVTNYILLEMGQPLHAFDYDRLRQNRILVRRARAGESFTTLDGQSRQLSPEILMICDGERSVALAGIMGGLNSEIFEGTRNVLIESACFDPLTIRRGAKTLGLSTEASYRFERGIDIERVVAALQRAMMLMMQLGNGSASRGLIDNYPRRYAPRQIKLRVKRTNHFLGTTISKDTMISCLKALELEVESTNEDHLRVTPPSFRQDLTREVDLMEEVARLHGYDKVPVTIPRIRSHSAGDQRGRKLRDRIRQIMVGLGFAEVINYSFIAPGAVEALGFEEQSPTRAFVRIRNPITEEQSVMRTTLIPGLLGTVQTNYARGEKTLKLFEVGKVFIARKGEELPVEPFFMAAILTGPYREKTWYSDDRPVDFYDIKGAAEALLKGLGLKEIHFTRDVPSPAYDAEASASLRVSGSSLGHLGRIAPRIVESYDLAKIDLFCLEMDLEALLSVLPEKSVFEILPKFPPLYRDLSIVVKREIESSKVMSIIRRKGFPLVESVGLFDVYEGKGLDASEKALAFRVAFRSKEGTLEGEEVNRLIEAVVATVGEETGGRLRDGGVHGSDSR